jgi:hypothetical protein
MSSARSDGPDLDVNDDGLVDAILPTRPCWQIDQKHPEQSTDHGPHSYRGVDAGRTWWRCRGWPLPDVHVPERTDP